MAAGNTGLAVADTYSMFSTLYFNVCIKTCPSSGLTRQPSSKWVVFQGLSLMCAPVLLQMHYRWATQ